MIKGFINEMLGKFIFLEGLDKTGKTTLARRCRFEADPRHPALIFDRGFVGREMFWHFNHEVEFPIEYWSRSEMNLHKMGMYAIVWLRCDPETIINRHVAVSENPPLHQTMREQEGYYERLMELRRRVGMPILETWTDRQSEDETVKEILEWAGFKWRKP